jgi:Platelet-activating factor acetylhydrolase, isoform II
MRDARDSAATWSGMRSCSTRLPGVTDEDVEQGRRSFLRYGDERYPATSSAGRRAQYMTPAESELQLTSRGITGVPPDVLSKVRTNAAVDATPAGHQRSLPLVVLSPGFTSPHSTLTALAEDLASHGYVVAGIDTRTRATLPRGHVLFPGG